MKNWNTRMRGLRFKRVLRFYVRIIGGKGDYVVLVIY